MPHLPPPFPPNTWALNCEPTSAKIPVGFCHSNEKRNQYKCQQPVNFETTLPSRSLERISAPPFLRKAWRWVQPRPLLTLLLGEALSKRRDERKKVRTLEQTKYVHIYGKVQSRGNNSAVPGFMNHNLCVVVSQFWGGLTHIHRQYLPRCSVETWKCKEYQPHICYAFSHACTPMTKFYLQVRQNARATTVVIKETHDNIKIKVILKCWTCIYGISDIMIMVRLLRECF